MPPVNLKLIQQQNSTSVCGLFVGLMPLVISTIEFNRKQNLIGSVSSNMLYIRFVCTPAVLPSRLVNNHFSDTVDVITS
jgi:hypothetical protein